MSCCQDLERPTLICRPVDAESGPVLSFVVWQGREYRGAGNHADKYQGNHNLVHGVFSFMKIPRRKEMGVT